MGEGEGEQQRVIGIVVQVGKTLLWLKEFGFLVMEITFYLSFLAIYDHFCFNHLLTQSHLFIAFYTSVAMINAEDTR